MCHHNTDYKIAELKDCCKNPLSELEQKISSESGKETVLIAYCKEC